MAKKRPGVLLYFDVRPSLRRLSLEEKGRLFEAILDYGELGEPPQFDGMLGIAWDFIQPRLDVDADRYDQRCRQAQEAAQKRWGKQSNAGECERIKVDAENASSTTTPHTPSTTTPHTPSTGTTATGRKGGAGGKAVIGSVGHTVTEGEFVAMREAAMRKLASHTP